MKALFTLPNLFTLSRIFLIPVVHSLLFSGQVALGMAVLLFSLLTDFFDGYVARKLNQESALGALLDPVADKIVVLAYLTIIYLNADVLPLWFLVLTYTRNISQLMSIPILSWWLKIPFKVKPKLFPKWGTGLSFVIMFCGVYLCSDLELARKQVQLLTEYLLIPASAFFELWILATYLPRLYQIATGKHDTFE